MALTREELDRKKFSGEGTGIRREGPPSFMDTVRTADAALGRGINYVGENLPMVPGKVMDAVTPERKGYSGEVNPVAAVGGFMSRMARSAPNTFGGAETAASAGQQPFRGLGFGVQPSGDRPRDVGAAQPSPAAPAATTARENLTGTPPVSTPAYPAAQQPAFQSLLGNGMTMTGDMQGNRTYTMGTPGQDGYGMMTVRGGQNAMAAQNLSGARSQAQSPYSFEGSPEDRSRFAQQPTQPAMQDGNTSAFPGLNPAFVRIREQQEAEKAAKEQLAGLDPRSGWGWKGRQELYKHQQALDQRANEEQTRAQIEAARLLSGQQQNQAQLAEQQRQFDEQAPLRQAETEAKQLEAGYSRQKNELAQRWQQATDPKEKEALYRQMLGLEGKEPKSNIETVDVPNPNDPMGGTMKVPARINQDGTYTRLQEQGGQQSAPAPQAALDYLKKNPGQAASFKQKYGYLPPGF